METYQKRKIRMKTFKQYNESLRDKMAPKSNEDIRKSFSDEQLYHYDKLMELKEYIEDRVDLDFIIGVSVSTDYKKTIYMEGEFGWYGVKIEYVIEKQNDEEYYYILIDDETGTDDYSGETVEQAFNEIYEYLEVRTKESIEEAKQKLKQAKGELDGYTEFLKQIKLKK
jgi:predicted RNase H-like HicB family nuclease